MTDPLMAEFDMSEAKTHKKTPEYMKRASAAYKQRCLESGKYRCEECDMSFRSNNDLDKHKLTRVHFEDCKPESLYECRPCHYITASPTAYKAHCKCDRHKARSRPMQTPQDHLFEVDPIDMPLIDVSSFRPLS